MKKAEPQIKKKNSVQAFVVRKRGKGATLFETTLAILILSLIIVSIFTLFLMGFQIWEKGQSEGEIVQSATLALERMVRDLRLSPQITVAQSDEITFKADLSGGGTIKSVRYYLSGQKLCRVVTEDPVLADNVTQLQFTYYDAENNLISDPPSHLADIALVKIKLTIIMGENEVELNSQVRPRNR